MRVCFNLFGCGTSWRFAVPTPRHKDSYRPSHLPTAQWLISMVRFYLRFRSCAIARAAKEKQKKERELRCSTSHAAKSRARSHNTNQKREYVANNKKLRLLTIVSLCMCLPQPLFRYPSQRGLCRAKRVAFSQHISAAWKRAFIHSRNKNKL